MRRLALLMCLAAAVLVAGCGSSSDDGGSSADASSSKPESVKVKVILDKTGIGSFANLDIEQSVKLAFDEANSSGMLGGTKIDYSIDDAGSEVPQATALVSKAVKQDYAAILFGTQSAESLAVAPIAERAGVPIVLVASGAADPNTLGDHVFRATAPAPSIAPVQSAYFKEKGVKRVAVIDAADSPLFKSLAADYAELGKKDGYEIVSTVDVTQADTEFSSPVSKVMASKPDAVVALVTGTQYLPLITGFDRAGYKGIIGAQSGIGSNLLKPLGQKAKGVVWPADYAASNEDVGASTQAFRKAFEAKYGKQPTGYNAEGYDAAMLIVQGLKNAKGYSHDEVLQGLEAAASAGFDTATGRLTFEGRDARTDGLLLTWDGSKEVPVVSAG